MIIGAPDAPLLGVAILFVIALAVHFLVSLEAAICERRRKDPGLKVTGSFTGASGRQFRYRATAVRWLIYMSGSRSLSFGRSG